MMSQGHAICHINHFSIVEPGSFTYCARAYRRWDANSQFPDLLDQQQKVLTIGGWINGPNGPDFLGIQISTGGTGEAGGKINTRFDGTAFDAPVDFQGLGNAKADCVNNFCRFELCLDKSEGGEGRARLRMTKVAPGSGQVTVFKPIGRTLRPGPVDFNAPAGWSLFGEPGTSNGNYVAYSTHILYTRTRPEDRSFWIGPACEVEGGCGDAPPQPAATPMAPTSVDAR
jgi:hypothetical protein